MNVEALENSIIDILSDFVRYDQQISHDKSLERDLGIDSLTKIEVLLRLEHELGIKLPDGFMSDIFTVGELIGRTGKFVRQDALQKKDECAVNDMTYGTSRNSEQEIILKRGKMFHKIFELAYYFALRITSWFFYRIKAKFIGNFPQSSFIIAANHSSYMDGYVISSILPWKIKRKMFFGGIASPFDKNHFDFLKIPSGILPLDMLSASRKVHRMADLLVNEGCNICIFPEGGRSYDGNLQKLRTAVAIIAENSGAPVYPVFIKGTFESWPRFKTFPKLFRKIEVIAGKPLFFDFWTENPREDFMRRLKTNILELGKLVEKDSQI